METQMKMLWHSAMPCFDLNGTTALEDGDSALLKMCFWKNVEIPCAAIFDKYPTDHGLCCSFNMQSANEIFHSGKFSETISKLQNEEADLAFQNKTKLSWAKCYKTFYACNLRVFMKANIHKLVTNT